MIEWVAPLLFVALFLACVVGAVFLFYRAIRLFMAKNIRRGVTSLVLSLVLGFIVFSVIQAVILARGIASQSSCASNLKQIMLSIISHANDHQDAFPPSFDDMVVIQFLRAHDASVFIDPASHHKTGVLTNIHSWTDYAYVSGLSEADPADCVAAFCLPESHKGDGVNVAFVDGHVHWYTCTPYKDATGQYQPTFQELTNTPSLFYGTTNEDQLADLKKRTRIIYPHAGRR